MLKDRLVRRSNGCLEWWGDTVKGGYGRTYFNGRMMLVHRIAWELVHGPIPEGLCVLHHCDNPPCCEAIDTEHHLFLGTQADNIADMMTKGRGRSFNKDKTHCPKGHPYNEENTYMYSNGARDCRACGRVQAASQRAKRGSVDA